MLGARRCFVKAGTGPSSEGRMERTFRDRGGLSKPDDLPLARIPCKQVYSCPRGEAALIASFGDKATGALFNGERGTVIRRVPSDIRSVALRKLDLLNAAHELKDLRVSPGSRLEALRGELRGRHSIRINDQWRIVFRWDNGDADEVEIDDYH